MDQTEQHIKHIKHTILMDQTEQQIQLMELQIEQYAIEYAINELFLHACETGIPVDYVIDLNIIKPEIGRQGMNLALNNGHLIIANTLYNRYIFQEYINA